MTACTFIFLKAGGSKPAIKYPVHFLLMSTHQGFLVLYTFRTAFLLSWKMSTPTSYRLGETSSQLSAGVPSHPLLRRCICMLFPLHPAPFQVCRLDLDTGLSFRCSVMYLTGCIFDQQGDFTAQVYDFWIHIYARALPIMTI